MKAFKNDLRRGNVKRSVDSGAWTKPRSSHGLFRGFSRPVLAVFQPASALTQAHLVQMGLTLLGQTQEAKDYHQNKHSTQNPDDHCQQI